MGAPPKLDNAVGKTHVEHQKLRIHISAPTPWKNIGCEFFSVTEGQANGQKT